MATAPERPRAGRRGYHNGRPSLIEWLNGVATICGECFGSGEVWCPECCGFGGCNVCNNREKVLCSLCAGGHLLPHTW